VRPPSAYSPRARAAVFPACLTSQPTCQCSSSLSQRCARHIAGQAAHALGEAAQHPHAALRSLQLELLPLTPMRLPCQDQADYEPARVLQCVAGCAAELQDGGPGKRTVGGCTTQLDIASAAPQPAGNTQRRNYLCTSLVHARNGQGGLYRVSVAQADTRQPRKGGPMQVRCRKGTRPTPKLASPKLQATATIKLCLM
jgi:hypothetical protein